MLSKIINNVFLTFIYTAIFWGLSFPTAASGDVDVAGSRCRSEAYELADAKDYCKNHLACDEDEMVCRGQPRRWICTCPNADVKSEEEQQQMKGDIVN